MQNMPLLKRNHIMANKKRSFAPWNTLIRFRILLLTPGCLWMAVDFM